MSTQGTIKRYSLILEKLNASEQSFNELKDYLYDQGFEISERTLQRDISQIRTEFAIEITYDRSRNTYSIDKERSLNLDTFLRFLEITATANILAESLKDGKEALNYISFESQGDFKGTGHLERLLIAVKDHRKIRFTHQNFESDKPREYNLEPYLLKEYQKRWYVVGLLKGKKTFTIFGIDRIEKLEVLAESFKRNQKSNPVELFENIVGVTLTEGKSEDIVLSVSPKRAKYLKSLPLHSSQEIVINGKEILVKLRIIPTLELTQKILMLGESVKVLKPKSLADEIKKSLEASLGIYNARY